MPNFRIIIVQSVFEILNFWISSRFELTCIKRFWIERIFRCRCNFKLVNTYSPFSDTFDIFLCYYVFKRSTYLWYVNFIITVFLMFGMKVIYDIYFFSLCTGLFFRQFENDERWKTESYCRIFKDTGRKNTRRFWIKVLSEPPVFRPWFCINS